MQLVVCLVHWIDLLTVDVSCSNTVHNIFKVISTFSFILPMVDYFSFNSLKYLIEANSAEGSAVVLILKIYVGFKAI